MDNSLKEKIAKIMEIAKRGGTENEMNVAMQKVQELLMKHNISMSDIENIEVKDEDIIEERHDGKHGQAWQGEIYYGISDLYFCQFYQTTYQFQGKRRISYVVVGKESNATTVRLIAKYLIDLCEELSCKQGQDMLFRNSFKRGFADRVFARCQQEVKQATLKLEYENKERALVVVNPYQLTKTENINWLKQKGIKLKQSYSYAPANNRDAYSAGQAAGNAVNLKSSATGRLN